MGITYILIFILFLHIYLFRKLIFKWNVFSVFFIATTIFSISGILIFPFVKTLVIETFWTFRLHLITDTQIIKTQCIALIGLLLVLYSYSFVLMLIHGKIKCINLLKIDGPITNNLSKSNYYFILFCISVFLLFYILIKRNTLITGIFDGLIGRSPDALLISRRSITSNYLYVIITYNLLPFLTIISLYISINSKSLLNKFIFYTLLFTSIILILLLFQKRPLILFLMCLAIAGFIFKRHAIVKKIKKVRSKKATRRRFILIGVALFSLLMLLYYSSTKYEFQNVFEAIKKLTEVSLTRIFGRLSIPAFFYVHYFPNVDAHYGISNIGTLSKIFGYDVFLDSRILFDYFSSNKKGGSLAISSIMDFYGAFGYYGLVIGSVMLGAFLSILDTFLDKLEKNVVNIVFIIFCFVFAYYLSQASLARSLLGYGFFFFVLTWVWLQKGIKIKLR